MPVATWVVALIGVLMPPQPPNVLRAVVPAPLQKPPRAAALQPPPLKPSRRHDEGSPGSPQSASAPEGPASSSVEGEYLVQSPNVFRGVSAAGAELGVAPTAILSREEQNQLILSTWFYLASTDARRQLASGLHPDGVTETEPNFDPNHVELVACMRERAAVAESAAERGAAKQSPAQTAASKGVIDMSQLLSADSALSGDLTDTEFRLRESVGRASYNKLFRHNQGLIYKEVNALLGANWKTASIMDKADFLQEGAQGLLRAIRLFDLGRGFNFSTYAVWHIRAYVLRAVRDKSRLVRLPQALQADMMQIRKARYRYAVDNQGVSPDQSQLAGLLQWSEARVGDAEQALSSAEPVSLDAAASFVESGAGAAEKSQRSLVNRLPSSNHGHDVTEASLMQQQLRSAVWDAQCERDPERAQMTRLKYGLEDGKEWTYPQLAERFNTTPNGVRGIVRREVAFLRKEKHGELRHFVGSDADC